MPPCIITVPSINLKKILVFYLYLTCIFKKLVGLEAIVWGTELSVKVLVVVGAFCDIRELVVNVSSCILVADQVLGRERHP